MEKYKVNIQRRHCLPLVRPASTPRRRASSGPEAADCKEGSQKAEQDRIRKKLSSCT